MTWLFITTYCIWISTEISLSLFRRSKKSDNKNSDKGTLALIWIIIIIANTLPYNVSGWTYLPISTEPALQYVGLSFIIVGMILSLTIVKSLGKIQSVLIYEPIIQRPVYDKGTIECILSVYS